MNAFEKSHQIQFLKMLDEMSQRAIKLSSKEMIRCVSYSRDLAVHNEPKIAIEDLCDNIHEWDFGITEGEFAIIRMICEIFDLNSSYTKNIENLIKA